MLRDDFYADIKSIRIAHENTLDRVHRCEYPRGRGSYGLIYALSGKAEYRFLEGERFSISEGEALFITPRTAYSVITEAPFRHYTINFEVHEDSSDLHMLSSRYSVLTPKNPDGLERIFKKTVQAWRSKKAGFEMQATSCLYELFSLFCSEYVSAQSSSSYQTYQRLALAKEHIERHFDGEITLERLAFISNMSVTNFRREWKKQYSKTPIQYRDEVRLYYAEEYLSSGYYTVSEIASKCGFSDVSYFVRFFKKLTGITPGAYKELNT